MLQAGRSWDRVLMRWIFLIYLILPAAGFWFIIPEVQELMFNNETHVFSTVTLLECLYGPASSRRKVGMIQLANATNIMLLDIIHHPVFI
jgi:hypothetical protein